MKSAISACLLSVMLVSGCKREERVFDPGPCAAQAAEGLRLSALHAGELATLPPIYTRYEESAYAVGEGKRLYSNFNCVGCHAHGGGAIGPALMDARWIYGSRPEQIYASIVQGRPNGMPSFAGKIADFQVWELVAYVRSLSGQLPIHVAPSRSDEMPVKKAEQAKEKERPTDENQRPLDKEHNP